MVRARSNRGRRRASGARTRAMTLLEVVAAIAVVALLCSTVLGAISYIHSIEQRQTHALACGELANRMMLQYLDDKSAMPSAITPLEYGASRYRWSVSESPVGFKAVEVTEGDAGTGRPGRNSIPPEKRYKLVTVSVWLGEESGGSMQMAEGVPNARIGRLIDILAFRNPDSATNLLSQPGKMQEILEAIGASAGPPAGGDGGGGGGRGRGQGQGQGQNPQQNQNGGGGRVPRGNGGNQR